MVLVELQKYFGSAAFSWATTGGYSSITRLVDFLHFGSMSTPHTAVASPPPRCVGRYSKRGSSVLKCTC